MIVVPCSCLGVLCLPLKLDTNFGMAGVLDCVLLFVVALVLCVLRDVRVVVLLRSPFRGIRSLS